MDNTGKPVSVGRLTNDGLLFGYIAIDAQRLSFSRRTGLKATRWSETRRRYRLDLLNDWDEDFLEPNDEADLCQGWFRFKGEDLEYEELVGTERSTVLAERFSDWA